jgi:hypothetical protein
MVEWMEGIGGRLDLGEVFTILEVGGSARWGCIVGVGRGRRVALWLEELG